MLKIIPHIEFLIRTNDCIILPGFGAFIARQIASTADCKDSNRLLPPCREICFNNAVFHNDGLLASSIMRKEQISYDNAMEIVCADIATLKKQIYQTGVCSIGSIGDFHLGDEDKLLFVPNKNRIQKAEYFGLRPISLTNIRFSVFNDNEQDELPTTRILPIGKRMFRIVASIAILLMLSFVLSTPISIDQLPPDYAGLNSSLTVKKETIQSEAKQSIIAPVSIEKRTEKEETAKKIIEDKNVQELGKPCYYVVVASLRTKEQAERYVKESDLKDLNVFGKKGGIYRVYAACGNSYEEMNAYIQTTSLRETNPDVWIYKQGKHD